MKQTVLFGITFGIGMLLVSSDRYITLLHELNHAIAAILTLNVPVEIYVGPEGTGGYATSVGITRNIPFVRDFIKTSGAGLAVATPGIIFIAMRKLKLAGLAGFFIPGIPGVLSEWGLVINGRSDFFGIDPLPWVFVHFFVVAIVYLIVIVLIGRDYENSIRKHHSTTKINNKYSNRNKPIKTIQRSIYG